MRRSANHHLRGVFVPPLKAVNVPLLPVCEGFLRELVLPADLVPVIDMKLERDDVIAIRKCGYETSLASPLAFLSRGTLLSSIGRNSDFRLKCLLRFPAKTFPVSAATAVCSRASISLFKMAAPYCSREETGVAKPVCFD